MLDAYTIKKVVPRLVAAIILIQLSWFIFTNLLRITNDIAFGIEGLMYAPFGGKEALNLASLINKLGGSGGQTGVHGLFTLMVVGGGLATGVALTAVGVLSLALSVFLGAMIAMFVLVLRRAVLVALLVVSPLALVAWILPGTEKYWKLWWESFSKLLMLFPMILLIVAAGRVLAFVSLGNGASGGVSESTASGVAEWVIVIVCYFGPYFLIPKTFQMAGSAFSSLAGMANDRSRGVFDRLKKGRQNMAKQAWQDNKNFTRFKNKRFDKLNTAFGYAANGRKAGLNPTRWRNRLGAAKSDNSLAQAGAIQEDADYASWKGNDTLNGYASLSENEQHLRRMLEGSGAYDDSADGRRNMERDIARVETLRRKYGTSAMRQATWQSAVAGGTFFDQGDGTANMYEAAAAIAGSDDAVASSLNVNGRKAALAAGRGDQGSMGYGDAKSLIDGFRSGRITSTAQGKNEMKKRSYKAGGAGTMFHSSMKDHAVRETTKFLAREMDDAITAGDSEGFIDSMVAAANGLDTMTGPGGTPQKADIFYDELMGRTVEVSSLPADVQASLKGLTGRVTVSEVLEGGVRGNARFMAKRREMNQQAPVGTGGTPQTPGSGPPGAPTGGQPGI